MSRRKRPKAARSDWSSEGDTIEIDIPNRTIRLAVEDGVLAERRRLSEEKGWQPEKPRKRKVTTALRAYAAFASQR
jgi:dihydroxy-acid dehydratase